MKLLPLLCLAALTLAADPRYREDFHYTYPQTPGGRFTLENFNGSVEIAGWDQNTVEIAGTKYAEDRDLLNGIKIEASTSGNAVQVRTVRPDHDHHGNLGARYVIHVPRRTQLENIHSSNGSIRVQDIDGDARLTTSNGTVRIANVHGNVEAHSSNGGVDASDIEGRMSFHTSNGSLHAERVRGSFEGSTSNGAIELRSETAQNDIVASTSNGGITLRLPAGLNARLHASTSSTGSVRSDFDVLTRGELSRHRIEGTIGSGGLRIDLTTSNGNISLLRI